MGLSIRQQKRQRFNRAAEVFPGMTWEIFQQLEAERGVYDEDKWLKLAEKPRRIQLSRKKGWRMPANTVKVDRSTKWGNPFHHKQGDEVGSHEMAENASRIGGVRINLEDRPNTADQAVATYLWWIESVQVSLEVSELRGKNLACWCKPGAKCHADVLLELANR